MNTAKKEAPNALDSLLFMEESTADSLDFFTSPICEHFPEGFTFGELTGAIGKEAKTIEKFMSYYACALMEMQTKFEVLNEEFSLEDVGNPIESIRTRLKSPKSLLGKVKRKGIPLTRQAIEDNIYDVAGIRVVCSFIEDIYTLADCILRQDDINLIRKKDYIANPKPNGYRGLHLIVEIPIFLREGKRMVKVEIQLRTIAMDFWAALEHKLRYKKDLDEDTVARIGERLQATAETAAVLDAGMQEIKHDIAQVLNVAQQPSGSQDLPDAQG